MKTRVAILVIILAIPMMVSSSLVSVYADVVDDYKYVINLASSAQPIQPYTSKDPDMDKYLIYTIKSMSGAGVNYHLRLGFFKTEKDAQSVMKRVEYKYLNVSVGTVTPDDFRVLGKWLQSQSPEFARMIAPESAQAVPAEGLMKLANQAMLENNYIKAIGIYTKITRAPPNQYQQVAQESLGVARERNNQLAHAKAEYDLYLETYPNGDGAARVKRRLSNLIAKQSPTAFIARRPVADKSEWHHYGDLYQFYYRNDVEPDNAGSITADSSISTNVNYTARTSDSASPMEVNIAASHIHDIDDADKDKERLTSMYFDMTSNSQLFDMRLGRQRSKVSSIFNRYDGIDMGYTMTPSYKAKLIMGYPVEFTDTVESRSDKYFYSLGLNFLPNKGVWDTSVFYIEQKADDLLDRQEIAIDTKFQNNYSSFYSTLDYSMQYETLNFFLANFNIRYQDESYLNIVANYRKSPFLTTTNALQGQPGVSSLADLLSTLTEDEIEQLSLDRTALYKSLSAYYTRNLYNNLQLTADITVSNMSGTVASAGVAALEDTGNEYSYSIGFISNNLFMNDDSNIINLRYSDLSTSDVKLLNLSSKLRLNRTWRITPRLIYDTRDYNDGRSSTAIRPSFSVKNRMSKHWQFEMELSYEDKEFESAANVVTNDITKVFYAGYIFSF